jgi:hypothetical protein
MNPRLAPALLALSIAPLSARAGETLAKALVFHASFDKDYDADFSKGDPVAYVKSTQGLAPVDKKSGEVLIAPDAGNFGGALWFPKKGTTRVSFKGDGVLGYNGKDWSATVSLWLRLTPDEDLEPGYCDPIQIIGDDTKKGFIFLEWSKDHTPRYFRYAIRPRIELWDPEGLGWEVVPEQKRPMVQLKNAPFSRDTWTHAVFTLERINAGTGTAAGALYLNGKLQGRIENFDLTFGWDPKAVMLVLGAAYVGHLDDVAIFNRVLTGDEVARLHGLEGGAASLAP